jgi:rhodanese-related sulfurtransferase
VTEVSLLYAIPSTTVSDLPDPLPDATTVLDVREPVEWDHGHIEGAVHIPLMDLPQRLPDVPRGHVLVVCRIGSRSARAVAYLQQQGIDAVNLDGGMVEWAEAGRNLVADHGHTPQVV